MTRSARPSGISVRSLEPGATVCASRARRTARRWNRLGLSAVTRKKIAVASERGPRGVATRPGGAIRLAVEAALGMRLESEVGGDAVGGDHEASLPQTMESPAVS